MMSPLSLLAKPRFLQPFLPAFFLLYLLVPVSIPLLQAQGLDVYQLTWRELESKRQVALVSLSEIYTMKYDTPDSLVLPDVRSMTPATAQYFQLTGPYRERFLTGTHVSEADRVFVYDYCKDILLTFLVKDLQVVASLSPYLGTEDWPSRMWDYQLGFNIPTYYLKDLTKYYRHVLVCIGKVNPFVQGQMRPIPWKLVSSAPADSSGLQPSFVDTTRGRHLECTLGTAYEGESNGYRYRLQDLNLRGYFYARLLQVYEVGKPGLVCQHVLTDGEGVSPAPLNFIYPEQDHGLIQWAGKLFRGKPPVMFGFRYFSFGCEELYFLHPTEPLIRLRCDNRH